MGGGGNLVKSLILKLNEDSNGSKGVLRSKLRAFFYRIVEFSNAFARSKLG